MSRSQVTFTKFMELPLELRSMIYDLVLVSDEPVSFRNHPSKNHLGQYLPLTQVSRQVREETTPLLYGQNVFEVKLRSIKVDEVEKVDEESAQQPLRQNKTPKMKISFRQRKPISPVPEHLLWGDRYATAWADIACPKQIAQVQQLAVTVVKADRNRNWNHLRHLSKSPSSLSQEHTGVFSARSWHLHAIELKCPGRHSVVWNLDCRENRYGDRRLNWYAKDLEDLYEPKPCSRCRLMLDGWRTQHNRQDGMSRALFLALVWPSNASMKFKSPLPVEEPQQTLLCESALAQLPRFSALQHFLNNS